MEHVSSLLKKALARRGLGQHTQAALLIHTAQQWFETHHPELVEFVIVKQFKDSVLFIESRNSISSQECHAIIDDLKAHLTNHFPDENIEDIRILRAN